MWLEIAHSVGSCSWRCLVRPVLILIRSVPKEVELLEVEWQDLSHLITEVDRAAAAAKDKKQDRMRSTVQDLRTIYFRIEDVSDEWSLCSSREKVCGGKIIHAIHPLQPCDCCGCVVLLCEKPNPFNSMCCVRLRIAIEVWDIKSDLVEIKERIGRDSIKIKSTSKLDRSISTRTPRVAWKKRDRNDYHRQTKVVGFEVQSNKLIHWLENGQKECSVMVVVGMGGQGKTTLAKQILKKKEVIDKFRCSEWITVSEFDDPKEFFKSILMRLYQKTKEELPLGFSDMTPDSLKQELTKYLLKKRFLLFFDDVWSEEFWKEMKHTFSNNEYGSRIIITTRNEEVAKICKKDAIVEVHQMQPLTENESLQLFMNIVAGKNPSRINFDRLSKEVVKECEGLPLGIVAIGKYIYANLEDASEWKSKIHKTDIVKSLCSSYDDLPEELKPCLLYFGINPQNFEVKSKRLIRQWIAEGFVSKQTGRTLEQVAGEYLTCLIDRNLVQVSSFGIDRKAKRCRVHYLIHDMILRKIEDLSFCQCIREDNRSDVSGITRRLSIITISTEELYGFFRNLLVDGIESSRSLIRSLHFFTKQTLPEDFVTRIPATKRPLKVLDFENCLLSSSTVVENLDKLENLIHLKYLSFRNTKIRSLPISIGELHNLETLDLRQTYVHEIPGEVSKLTKLRCLFGDNMSLIQLKDSIAELESLQTLRDVKLDDVVGLIAEELGKLWKITDLGLTNVGNEHGSAICSEINKMVQLEKLRIAMKPGSEVIDLQLWGNASMIQRLRLEGKLNKLPGWVLQSDMLAKLVLSGSKLTDDKLNSLKNIQSLWCLSIINEAYEGESLHFEEGAFEHLGELELGSLNSLSSITIHSKALQSLEKLHLRDISQLKELPSNIQHLTKLKDLSIEKMRNEFAESIAPGGQHKHQIIKHVPRVIIDGVLMKE